MNHAVARSFSIPRFAVGGLVPAQASRTVRLEIPVGGTVVHAMTDEQSARALERYALKRRRSAAGYSLG
jgi:hypothetical protein